MADNKGTHLSLRLRSVPEKGLICGFLNVLAEILNVFTETF